jgi:hypothetical protein
MNSTEKKYEASKAQGLLKDYGDFIGQVIAEINKENDARIIEDTAEKIGIEYAKRQAAKDALKLLMQKINSKANERN